MTDRITIFDTTLRDGEQAPGFSLKVNEKLQLARQLDALGVDVTPRLKTLKVVEPGKRKAGVMVKDVSELVDKLKNEAKVI